MCIEYTTTKERNKKVVEPTAHNPVNISFLFFPHTHHLLCMHACMIPFVFSSNRAKNEMRKQSHACICPLITSRRFAPLHRLTRFLLLLSIIIVASHCALLHFLLKPSSSILSRFRFSSSSSSASSLPSFIHSFMSLMNRIVTTTR